MLEIPIKGRWHAWSNATSGACVGSSLEEERVMQQSRDKYFPQFENQGINPVGENSQITNTCTNNQTTCTQRDKRVVNPFTVTCKSEI